MFRFNLMTRQSVQFCNSKVHFLISIMALSQIQFQYCDCGTDNLHQWVDKILCLSIENVSCLITSRSASSKTQRFDYNDCCDKKLIKCVTHATHVSNSNPINALKTMRPNQTNVHDHYGDDTPKMTDTAVTFDLVVFRRTSDTLICILWFKRFFCSREAYRVRSARLACGPLCAEAAGGARSTWIPPGCACYCWHRAEPRH